MQRTFTISKLAIRSEILGLLIMMQISVSGQVSHAVSVTSNVFTPDEIIINEGDTVVWTNNGGVHNVNGMQASYPSNPESFGNNVGSGWTFSHVFTITGTYDYQCDPHVALGMVGKVTVLDLPPDTLTINFIGMTPHVGQMLTLYVREGSSGNYLDTIMLSEIPGADFKLESFVIEPGGSYLIDFFADHNGNGIYDAPPTDHAWRLETGEVTGNKDVEFTHNTDFTNIFVTTGLEENTWDFKLSVYPNPATDILHIESSVAIESLSVISVTGTRLKTVTNIQSTYPVISLEGISAGVYFIEIRTADHDIIVNRLVKQ